MDNYPGTERGARVIKGRYSQGQVRERLGRVGMVLEAKVRILKLFCLQEDRDGF